MALPAGLRERLSLPVIAAPMFLVSGAAPHAANLIVHRTSTRLPGDLAQVVKHRVPLVIARVGHPGPVMDPVHG